MKVSVVMCTYNGERFLREQLDSIINQTYPIYEIIIQDDCSSDSTWEILKEYEIQCKNLHLYKTENNLGYSNNFKSAILHSLGDYIALSDQDDIWMSNKIEILVNAIGKQLLAVGQSKVDDFGVNIPSFKIHNPDISIEKLVFGNVVSGHQILFSSSIKKYIQQIEIEIVHDYLITLIAYWYSSVVIVSDILQVWRRHENANSGTLKVVGVNKKWELIKGYKFFYTLYCLLCRKKSKKIEEGFFKIHYVFLILAKDAAFKNSKYLIKLTNQLGKQTVISYFIASLMVFQKRKLILKKKKLNIRESFASLTMIYKWWFDHRFDM